MTRGQSKSETLYIMDRIDERFPSGLKMKLQATDSTVPPLDHLDCNTVVKLHHGNKRKWSSLNYFVLRHGPGSTRGDGSRHHGK